MTPDRGDAVLAGATRLTGSAAAPPSANIPTTMRDAVCATKGVSNAITANVDERRNAGRHTSGTPRHEGGRVKPRWQYEPAEHAHECQLPESSPAFAHVAAEPSRPSLLVPRPGWITRISRQVGMREISVTVCDCLLARTQAARKTRDDTDVGTRLNLQSAGY